MILLITSLIIIYLLGAIAVPLGINGYYLERYGKSWKQLADEHWHNAKSFEPLWYDEVTFLAFAFWPITLFGYLGVTAGIAFLDKVLIPAASYPGKLLGRNIKHQEERGLLSPHVKTNIEEEAWREVEDCLKNKE